MPCRDWTVEDRYSEISKEKAMLRASLCALMTALETDDAAFGAILKKIDWKEAGVTKRELLMWWEDHKEQDRVRKVRETKEAAEKKLRAEALAKLTPEEKKVLGIK